MYSTCDRTDIPQLMTVVIWILASVVVLAGLAGLVVPPLPGALLVFGGLLMAAWADNFLYVGAGTITLLAVLALLTYVVDFLASVVGVKRFNASRSAMIGAMIGATVGLLFGLPGIFLGPFFGAALGELWVRRGLGQAGRAGVGASIGLVVGVAVKLMLGFAMVGVFAAVRFL